MGNENPIPVKLRWPAMLVAAVAGALVSPVAAAHLLAVSVSTSAQQVQVTNLGTLGPFDVELTIVHDVFCPVETVSVVEHTVTQVAPDETRVVTFAQLGLPSLCADGKLVVTARGRALPHQDIVLAHDANAAAQQGLTLADCTSTANIAKIETDLVFTNWFDGTFIPGGCSQGTSCVGIEEYELRVDNRSAVDSYGVGLKAKYQCLREDGNICSGAEQGCIGGPGGPGEDEWVKFGVVPHGHSLNFRHGTGLLPRCCDSSAAGKQCALFQVTRIGSGVCAPAFILPRTFVNDPNGPSDPELGCAFTVSEPAEGDIPPAVLEWASDNDADGANDYSWPEGCDCHLDCSGPLGCENPASDVFAVPLEATGARFRVDATTLEWDGQRYNTGAANVFDVVRGNLPTELGAPASGQSCLELGSPDTTSVDSANPSQGPSGFSGFYYWVRGRNPCGSGVYGSGSSPGSVRLTNACGP